MKEKNSFATPHSIFAFLKTKLGRLLVVSALGVSTAIGCGWSYVTDHSVRFNSLRTGRGFYRLPPLPLRYDPVTGKEQTAIEVGDYGGEYDSGYYEEQQATLAKPGKVWEKAMAASEAGDLSGLEKTLQKYLEMTKYPNTDDSGSQRSRRSTAADLLDALTELRHGSDTQSVMAYVTARLDHVNRSPAIGNEIPTDVTDQNLKDNWEYLRAAILYDSDKKDDALVAFQEHESRFPRSEKKEAAMYMIGRIKLEQSHSFAEKNCGVQGTALWGKEIEPADIEDPDKCRDQNWKDAMGHFKEMIRKYPDGRYSNDVRGWIAFLYKRGGQRAEALADYYRLLGQTKDAAWRLEAKKSLQIIGHEYDDATLDKLEALIADEPEAALAYAYHRIYNHATDFSYTEFDQWCCSGEAAWSEQAEETKRVKAQLDKGRHELERVAKFATAMVKRYGNPRVSGDFLLRVAESQLELQNSKDALTLADKALALGVKGDSRAQALWVKGSAEHQQKKLSAAKITFSRLVKEFPDHKLTEGARRLLAITAEDQGDLEFALDQYIALNYKYDVAYFVDVLLPTDRLAKYVEARRDTDHYNFLLYSLGIRYMRDRRWIEARGTLKSVVTRTMPIEPSFWDDPPAGFSKEPEYGDNRKEGIIQTAWVIRDVQTIEDLERLETAAATAIDDEAKAEAMYQLASYQFDADELLFYNPAAWDGARHMLLHEFISGNHLRLPGEAQGVFEYSKSHETLARAIPIFLDIVDRYPHTKAAKDALYSAVIAHEKLGDMNPYWRDIYASGFFAGQRLVANSDIRRMFPKFKWPISRLEWEASTRTVSGGSAYPPPPKPQKPAPKLTRTQRIERKLKGLIRTSADKIESKAGPVVEAYDSVAASSWDVLFALVCFLAVGYVSVVVMHFRKTSLPETSHISLEDLQPETLSDTESRVEKMLDNR